MKRNNLMGVYWIRPDVRPSVRPSVDKVSGTFWEKKTIGSIHFIFGPMVAKYLAENGVSRTFWKKLWPNSFHTWNLPIRGESLDPYIFSCSWPHFRSSGGQIFGRLQNINLYWIFLGEVGSDQSGGILSPFMGTACWFSKWFVAWSSPSHYLN